MRCNTLRKSPNDARLYNVLNELYLTAAEIDAFQELSDALREGWVVHEEKTDGRADDPARRAIRMQMLRLRDPKLMQFVASAQNSNSADALAALILDTDMAHVSDHDMAELFFAIGHAPVTAVVASLLARVSTDEDVEAIAALTLIRHSLLAAHSPTSA